MAVSITVSGVHSSGNLKMVHGTFTSAVGDNTLTLAESTHGLNHIVDHNVTLNDAGMGTQSPKVTISSGTLTAVWQDTRGFSGKWYVKGR